VSTPQVDAITARLLAAPRLISAEWLKDTAGRAEGRDAVPFAAPSPLAPAVAGRLAAAVRASGERIVLACPVRSPQTESRAVAMSADGPRIHSTLDELGTPDALVVVQDLSRVLLTTGSGYAVAAGPHQFIEAVAGADVRRVRAGFAEFVLGSLVSSAEALEAASYYGCALSGRSWRPAWLAWSHPAGVPHGTGIGGQLAAMRQFADSQLGAEEFAHIFRAARWQEMRAGERATPPLSTALDNVSWALDGYAAAGDGVPRAPGDLDLDGLREAVNVALSDM
jgi:hypothetical protein